MNYACCCCLCIRKLQGKYSYINDKGTQKDKHGWIIIMIIIIPWPSEDVSCVLILHFMEVRTCFQAKKKYWSFLSLIMVKWSLIKYHKKGPFSTSWITEQMVYEAQQITTKMSSVGIEQSHCLTHFAFTFRKMSAILDWIGLDYYCMFSSGLTSSRRQFHPN